MQFLGSVLSSRPWFLGLFLILASSCAHAQTASIPARITEAIDENNRVTLTGNVHPLARAEFDQGPAQLDFRMDRMLLVLKRSQEQEAALQRLLDDQQDKASPFYRKWLTPEQFGKQFGPPDADIQTVVQWMLGHGFDDLRVSKGRTRHRVLWDYRTGARNLRNVHSQVCGPR